MDILGIMLWDARSYVNFVLAGFCFCFFCFVSGFWVFFFGVFVFLWGFFLVFCLVGWFVAFFFQLVCFDTALAGKRTVPQWESLKAERGELLITPE